jgi:hypothetical protein
MEEKLQTDHKDVGPLLFGLYDDNNSGKQLGGR